MALKNRPSGLGRGLNAIFDIEERSSAEVPVMTESADRPSFQTDSVEHMALSCIIPNPEQPRKHFDDELLGELAQSIRSLGIIQPLTVKDMQDGRYVIISGERRYKAAIRAGLTHVPVYIRRINDQKLVEMALVENIQREDLNPMEIAGSLERLLNECSLTHDELSLRIGKNRATISNYIRLFKLVPQVQLALRGGELSMGHAKVLLALSDPMLQTEAAERVVSDKLSVRDTEILVKRLINRGSEMNRIVDLTPVVTPDYFRHFEHKLENIFGRKISINRNTKGESKIVISFKSDKEVEELLGKLSDK